MNTVTDETARVHDAPSDNWVYRLLPRRLWAYAQLARWDRPIGVWLLLFPCWWSSALAAAPHWAQLAGYMALFTVGAIAMRGAGCTWNDITDRDIDAAVARTRSRPIPSGQVSLRAALVWMVAQALIAALPDLEDRIGADVKGWARRLAQGAQIRRFPAIVINDFVAQCHATRCGLDDGPQAFEQGAFAGA